MMKTIIRLLKNPRVRQMLIWLGPLILSWISSRAKKSGSRKSVKSKRYR